METKKHNYRNAYKSDFLSATDIEELIDKKHDLIFTIKEVKQEFDKSINGKKVAVCNIAYFTDTTIKPLVLNAGNSKILRSFHPTNSIMVEDWTNIRVQLYVENNVKFGKEVTQGVRISPLQPKEAVKKEFTKANFEKAKAAKATIEMIKKSYSIDEATEIEYTKYCNQ